MLLMNLLVILIFGLIVGSFLTAYTYRLPRDISIFKGRSVCPKCKRQIAWYDNFPLISYILLKGKCRKCGKRISTRYPLIELSTSVLFVVTYFVFTNCAQLSRWFPFQSGVICEWQSWMGTISLPIFLIMLSALIVIFVIDLENQIIPDYLVFRLFAISFILVLLFIPASIYNRMISAFGTAMIFLMLHLITKGKGMGLGDVKFVIFGGFLLGWPEVFSWLFISFVTGGLIGSLLLITRKVKFGKQIAFGPFLVFGLIIALIFGDLLQIRFFLGL